MDSEQIIHCLEQAVHFSDMLARDDTSHSRDTIIAQLAFNWGRYCELSWTNRRFIQLFLQKRLAASDYVGLRDYANILLKYWKPKN